MPPTLMSDEQVIMLFCEQEEVDYVAKAAAAAIRKVFQCLKDEMPGSPQPSDLESEKFEIPSKVNKFLTCLLIVKGENQIRSRSIDSKIL